MNHPDECIIYNNSKNIHTLSSLAFSTTFKTKQIFIVTISPNQSQRPPDQRTIALMQDDFRPCDLNVNRTYLVAIVIDIDRLK